MINGIRKNWKFKGTVRDSSFGDSSLSIQDADVDASVLQACKLLLLSLSVKIPPVSNKV